MGRFNSRSALPESKGLTWDDPFFEGEDDVVAVFDFDYEKVEEFNVAVCQAMFFFPPVCIFGTLACLPCVYKQNVHWDTYSKHVAITEDGIRFVQEKRKFWCGFDFQDQGKTSKTVPFDKITDCDIEEPAGATCICVENTLYILNVDTASGSRGGEGGPSHELSLAGLKNAEGMKKLVWAMKRHQGQGGGRVSAGVSATPPPTAPSMMNEMDRGDSFETNAILREIRDELRQLNSHLRTKS